MIPILSGGNGRLSMVAIYWLTIQLQLGWKNNTIRQLISPPLMGGDLGEGDWRNFGSYRITRKFFIPKKKLTFDWFTGSL